MTPKNSKSNHLKAPKAAVFVEMLRELFGKVSVEYVNENGFVLGRPGPEGVPFTMPIRSAADLVRRAA